MVVDRASLTPSSCSGGGTGLLVPHRDPGAIAAALRRVLTDAALARRHDGRQPSALLPVWRGPRWPSATGRRPTGSSPGERPPWRDPSRPSSSTSSPERRLRGVRARQGCRSAPRARLLRRRRRPGPARHQPRAAPGRRWPPSASGAWRSSAAAQAADGAFRNRLGSDRRGRTAGGRRLVGPRPVGARARGRARPARPCAGRPAAASSRARPPLPARPGSMAFAALGAAEVAVADPDDAGRAGAARRRRATSAAARRATGFVALARAPATYANAMLAGGAPGRRTQPSATIASSTTGSDLLGWLLDTETSDGHLSVTPVGGLGPRRRPRPASTSSPSRPRRWPTPAPGLRVHRRRRMAGGRRPAPWLVPSARTTPGMPLLDPSTGGGYDGLEPSGRNANQGAESTLALISTDAARPLRSRSGR